VSDWPSPKPTGFERCLYIVASLDQSTTADRFVMVFAFCYMAAAIAKERQQQLFTQALRRAWFPRAHLSGCAIMLCATEAVLSWIMLSWVPMAMLSLILGGSDGFSAQNMVLNGLSMAFILVLDDELAEFVLSADEIEEIEEELKDASKGLVRFRVNKMKGFVRSFLAVLSLLLGIVLASQLSCALGAAYLVYICVFFLGTFLAWVGEAAVDVRCFGWSRQILMRQAGEAVVVILCSVVGLSLWILWSQVAGLDGLEND
jgi:hypothetical protein